MIEEKTSKVRYYRGVRTGREVPCEAPALLGLCIIALSATVMCFFFSEVKPNQAVEKKN